jgi:hypothetical protein
MSVKESIAKIIEGFEMLSESLEGESTRWGDRDEEETQPEPAPEAKVEDAEEETEEVVESTDKSEDYPVAHYKEEEFVMSPTNVKGNFSYRQLKSFCAELDLGGTGKTEELQAKLLDFINADVPEEIAEELEENEEEEKTEKKGASQLEKELETPNPEEAEAEEFETEDETLYDKVETMIEDEDLDVEDLASLLSDIGYSPKGKKQALIAKIVEAIENGDLKDFGNVVTEYYDYVVSNPRLKIEDYMSDYLEIEPTEERAETIEDRMEEVDELLADDELSVDDMQVFLEDYFSFDDEIVVELGELEDNQIEVTYREIIKNLVNDDGEPHELEVGYLLDGEYACCGKHLVETDDGNLFCEVCETEYEVE